MGPVVDREERQEEGKRMKYNILDIENTILNDLADMACGTRIHAVIAKRVVEHLDIDGVESESAMWEEVRTVADFLLQNFSSPAMSEVLVGDYMDHYVRNREACDNCAIERPAFGADVTSPSCAIKKAVKFHIAELWYKALCEVRSMAEAMSSARLFNVNGHEVRVWQGVDGDIIAETRGASLCASMGDVVRILRECDPRGKEMALALGCVRWVQSVAEGSAQQQA